MSRLRRGWLAFLLLTGSVAAQDAPPDLPYSVRVLPSGDAALDALLEGASPLRRLAERAPTDAEGVAARVAQEAERLRPAFESQGFWAGRARVALAGDPPEAPPPDAARLAAAPRPVLLEIRPEPGPRYHLRRVETQGATPIPLAPGAPARADTVLDAEAAALAAWRAEGRPLARVDRAVTVDHGAQAMDVTWQATPGPVADFAPVRIEGAERVRPEVARRVAAVRLDGQRYSEQALARARTDLLALGAFGAVRVETGTALDAQGRLPVTLHVTERPFRAFGATAAYETNFGAALGLHWEHRNLFGGAERLRVELEASRLGAALDRTNARLAATYREPIPFGFSGTLVAQVALLRQRLDSFDRDAVTFSLQYERRLSPEWVVAAGPVAEIGRSGPPGGPLADEQVAGFATQARYDGTDSLLDPRRGLRGQVSITPSYAFSGGKPYLALRGQLSGYWDVLGSGQTILAGRLALGSLLNARAEEVPQSQRFFAGGGGSVRGFDFQSIGPKDANGRPIGGASLLEGSIEIRQRIPGWLGGNLGAVAFVDAGAVGERSFAPVDAVRVGVGVGVRYHTPFGPIRADVAVPVIRQPGSGNFGIYIGIGHAF